MNGERVTGALFALAGCASAAAIGVASILTDHDTVDALIVSAVLGGIGLVQGRRIAAPHPNDGADDEREPSVAQDPTQRRIDAVLDDVSWKRITPEQGQELIALLRGVQPPAELPPYGTTAP